MIADVAAPSSFDPRHAVRRLSGEGKPVMERMQGSSLLQDGHVYLIVLDPIAERFGSRWEAKRQAVYDHVGRVLDRTAGVMGFFTRVSETDFLVVLPDVSRFTAQSQCQKALSEIWRYFMGEAPEPMLLVHRVTELSSDEITAAPLNPGDVVAGEAAPRFFGEEDQPRGAAAAARTNSVPRAPPAPARPEDQEVDLSPARWSPFIGNDGRTLRVSCALEPVFNLKTNARIGFRLRRTVFVGAETRLTAAQVANLSRGDLLRVDMATIARGLARLQSEGADKAELTLIVPVSYISLAHPQSCTLIAAALGSAGRLVRAGVICEICDADNVPQGSLLSAITLIRPRCLRVAAYVHAPPDNSLRAARLDAISVSCPPNMEGDAEFIGWLKPWIQAGLRASHTLMVYRCGTVRRLAMAGLLGATHGSIAAGPS